MVNEAEEDMKTILERVERQNSTKEGHLEKLQQVKQRMETLLVRGLIMKILMPSVYRFVVVKSVNRVRVVRNIR